MYVKSISQNVFELTHPSIKGYIHGIMLDHRNKGHHRTFKPGLEVTDLGTISNFPGTKTWLKVQLCMFVKIFSNCEQLF